MKINKSNKTIKIGQFSIRTPEKTDKYPQFDAPMTFDQKKKFWQEIYENTDLVKEHAFLPMILRQKEFIKFRMVSKKGRKIAKYKTKLRPIVEVAHKDAAIYKLYSAKLSYLYEERVNNTQLDKVATAYRPIGKSNIESSCEVMKYIASTNKWIIKGDFKGFFDNLDHKYLKQQLNNLISPNDRLPDDWYHVYKSLIHSRTIKVDDLPKEMIKFAKQNGRYIRRVGDLNFKFANNDFKISKQPAKGIPQGTSISAVMANVYMIEFDETISKWVTSFNGLYRRYSDDFVIVLPGDLGSDKVRRFMNEVIGFSESKIKLRIEKDKTKLLNFDAEAKQIYVIEGNRCRRTTFDYLGFEFDGANITLRTKGHLKFTRKSRRSVRQVVFLRNQSKKILLSPDSTSKQKRCSTYIYSMARHDNTIYYMDYGNHTNFYKYAIRAAECFEQDKDLYHVSIRKQARTLQKKIQNYYHSHKN